MRNDVMRFGFLFLAAIAPSAAATPVCGAGNTIYTEVVAIEHAFQYNRFGAFNPAGMIFALRHDVVPASVAPGEEENYFKNKSVEQLWAATLEPGKVRLRKDKRPRPLVLRMNEGDCLHVRFTNLLSPFPIVWSKLTVPAHALSPTDSREPVPFVQEQSEYHATREASLHVNGLDYARGPQLDDGAFVGMNASSLASPGQQPVDYIWYGQKEGGYLLFSSAATTGGEGDGGQIGLGLFGAVNVEPRKSVWYRSQVTNKVIKAVTPQEDYSRIDYKPLALLQPSQDRSRQLLVYSDLNAIIEQPTPKDGEKYCREEGPSQPACQSFREFTVIFHDEITATQAFAELADESNPISSVKDGMGINYGVSAMGPLVMANLKKIGPAANCAECKFEEFFLSSWANGDPALLTTYEDDPSNVHHAYVGDPVRFRNLHAGPKETHVFHLHAHQWLYDFRDEHSTYLDSQTISPGASYTYAIQYGGAGNRNFTVGDSIFHCHLYPHFAQGMWELWRAHDVFEDGRKGVWNADQNPRGRWLPDAEFPDGTPNPALIPIRGLALAPLPNKTFGGYPFYIPGRAGHRPPQPPLDMDVDPKTGQELNGGLSRHLVLEGESVYGDGRPTKEIINERKDVLLTTVNGVPLATPDRDANALGTYVSAAIAERVTRLNGNPGLTLFAKKLERATLHRLPLEGTPGERFAMRFHQGMAKGIDFHGLPGKVDKLNTPANRGHFPTGPGGDDWWKTMGYWSKVAGGEPTDRKQFAVNGRLGRHLKDSGQAEPKSLGQPGAPYADPCATGAPEKKYRAAYLQFDMTVNKSGWHDPQARVAVLEEDIKDTLEGRRPAEPLFFRANSGQCITFAATNLIPSALNVDDFQIFSPTDILGQHIHLVKFDVTSSDGSGNGWNYEDGTLSPDEIRERVKAHNKANPGDPIQLKTHPLFIGGAMAGDKRGWCGDRSGGSDNNPWCGAQTTVQRWYADPLLDRKGEDRTLRTVFTHDHFGPSSHQHHGLYAALVVEPKGAIWKTLDNSAVLGTRKHDGGPTSYRANISVPGKPAAARREFNMAFADFALLYTKDMEPVNPPNRGEATELPGGAQHEAIPEPEGISGGDPGTQLINYRNEPIPLRIAVKNEERDAYQLRASEDPRGKIENIFRSDVHAASEVDLRKPSLAEDGRDADLQTLLAAIEKQRQNFLDNLTCASAANKALKPFFCEYWRVPGDPATPLLAAYEGDPIQIRLVQGAQEEQHIFTMTGVRWPMQIGSKRPRNPSSSYTPTPSESKSSGFVNAQQIGISEHMEFEIPISVNGVSQTDYLYMSSAADNLWDGMWGLVRSIGWTENTTPRVQPHLARVVAAPPTPIDAGGSDSVCPGAPTMRVHVGAWLARDIIDPPPGSARTGLVYNNRFLLHDPNAIVFVEENPRYNVLPDPARPNRAALLTELRARYASNPLEPLILRAAAGSCIQLTLNNYLSAGVYDDRWKRPDSSNLDEELTHKGTFNTMPPITEGFNFNQFPASTAVGLTPQLLEFDMRNSSGVDVGCNSAQSSDPDNSRDYCKQDAAAPLTSTATVGKPRVYTWYAGERIIRDGKTVYIPHEYGGLALRNLADPIKATSHGAVGMLIVEPKGSCSAYPTENISASGASLSDQEIEAFVKLGYCRPASGNIPEQFLAQYSGRKATADIRVDSKLIFRDFGLIYQDDLSLLQGEQPLPNLRGGDDAEDSGGKAFNYRTEPLWARIGAGTPEVHPNDMAGRIFSNSLSSTAPNGGCGGPCGDPETPVFTASAGMEVRFHVVHPGGHPRQHGFSLFGHSWNDLPWRWVWDADPKVRNYSQVMETNHYSARLGSFSGIGPARHVNIRTCAGGIFNQPGDYLFRTQEAFQFQGGLWGIFRVTPAVTGTTACSANEDQTYVK